MQRGNQKVTDDQVVEAVRKHGLAPAARVLGISRRQVQIRRRKIEQRRGIKIVSPIPAGNPGRVTHYIEKGRIYMDLPDGVVVSASDCHYWPGPKSLMHRALVHLLKSGVIVPDLFVLNGDVCDMARLSRFPDVEWDYKPTPKQELECSEERLHEIVQTLRRRCRKIWTCGNHDSRWQRYLIERAPELAEVRGASLKDWFPEWETAWDVHVNATAHHPGDRVVFKHRYKGGVHHAYNDTLHSGRTTVTADKHALIVTDFSDLNGTRWGVDNGCIADTRHVAFAYGENNPRNWRDGFAVLTFKDGRLLPPQVVRRWGEDEVVYLGQVHRIPAEGDNVRPGRAGVERGVRAGRARGLGRRRWAARGRRAKSRLPAPAASRKSEAR